MSFMKEKRAAVGFPVALMFLFLVIFITLAGVAIEYGRAAAIKRNVEDGLSKALNDAVQLAMLDEYRQEHISHIDTAEAEAEAFTYMNDVLGLQTPAYVVLQSDGRVLYRLENVVITSQAEPPHMTLTCTLIIPQAMFSDVMGDALAIHLEMRVDSRNQRLEPDP